MLLQVGPDRIEEDSPHDPEVGVRDSGMVVEAAQVHEVGLWLKHQVERNILIKANLFGT